ncbi:92cdecc5-6def-4369-962b-22917dca70a8 [Sclerotinia trifoliorum]|uniref:92cdecc5-6def-4369-962b-22917dca70a8 n=1 Tax=Sclerotinia trifoliorum TaxID=28548 RepID=A0A8H2VMH0_9HELO|nr:92cdecc5-6def-4369-962b-22917dca70a8 [Sclerotinia trifoliorum]
MQFSAALISAITVALASAATIGQRDEAVFKVSDFSAGCIEHSAQCYYEFSLIQPGTMETTGVSCLTQVNGNADGTLPNIGKWQGECKDSSRTFWVVRQNDGLKLWASQPVTPASNQTASHLIPSSQLTIDNYLVGKAEKYTGPTAFDLI